jgi:hypothetical protein
MNSTMAEEWKVIEKASNYEVSNTGNIRSKITNKILKPTLINGYLAVGVRIEKKTKMSFIHREVAISFLICSNDTYIVNHKDGNRTNNNLENLEWVSQSENVKHAYRSGLNKGKRLSVSQFTLDNIFVKQYKSLLDAEIETGISNGQISNVCRGIRGRKTAGGYIWKYTDYIPITQSTPEGKIITGYPNYIITNDGKVYNSQREKYLTPGVKGGYMFVGLSDCEKRRDFSIHRLVATMFLENPNNYTEINHIDYDKTNNNVSNLEWISRSDNMKHNFKT